MRKNHAYPGIPAMQRLHKARFLFTFCRNQRISALRRNFLPRGWGFLEKDCTIIGGLFFGLSRKAATEFSFFLAVPTLFAATFYSLYKERALLSFDDIGMWVVGFVSAFISAFLCVRWLLRFISSHDFTPFAWYRIAFGVVVLATWQLDLVAWTHG